MTEAEAHVRCPWHGKRSYATERDALRALHRVRKARRGRGTRERAYYLCPRCGLWHLTSKPQT